MQPGRMIVVVFAALAITVFVNVRAAFSQDAAVSADADSSAPAAAGADADWERTGPAIDEDAETADKVLEIPQVTCAKDGAPDTCDGAGANANDDDGQAINAPSPGAPPPTLDDDTASNAGPNQDWGTIDDYQNQQAYAFPYPLYPYPATVVGTMNRPSPLPASAYVPMSSPLTRAARPPLNPGPWMMPPSMSAFGRPAGSPMMPMMMSAPSFGFHH